jgi:hypothetical protein
MGHPRDLRSRAAADRQQPGAKELPEVSADCRGIAVADPSNSGYRYSSVAHPNSLSQRVDWARRTSANAGERPWTSEGRVFAQIGGRKLRPLLRLAAVISDATTFRADLIERRFRRSESIFHPAEDAGFEPARACTQPAFQIRKPRSTLVCTSPSTPAKRSLKRSRMATNEDN